MKHTAKTLFGSDAPFTVADCGCVAFVEYDKDGHEFVDFEYCPLHQAAEELAEACESTYQRILSKHECYDRDECHICQALNTLGAALAKLEAHDDQAE